MKNKIIVGWISKRQVDDLKFNGQGSCAIDIYEKPCELNKDIEMKAEVIIKEIE